MMNLSENEKRTLAGAKGSRIGTEVQADPGTMMGLRDAGMVGRNGGLTMKGSIAAQKLQDAQLDALFGSL